MKNFPQKIYYYNAYDDVADLYELTPFEKKEHDDILAVYVCKRTGHMFHEYVMLDRVKEYPEILTEEDLNNYLKHSFAECEEARTNRLNNKLKEVKENIECFERCLREAKDSANKIKDQLAKPLQYLI